MQLTIQTDGASRGNPGPASYGYLILDSEGEIIHQEGEKLGIQTNNFAEYTAVVKALEYIRDHIEGPHDIKLIADSKLVVEQLSGRYKIKNVVLKGLFDDIKLLEMQVGAVSYQHTLRVNNTLADRLANEALDRKQ